MVGHLWRQVVCGNEKNQRPAPLRMADCELHRRPGARRDGDDKNPADSKAFEKFCVGVGLHCGDKVGRQSRSEVAEATRGDELVSAPSQHTGHVDGLIESAAGAMDS